MDYKQELITTIHDFGCNLELLEEKILDLSEQSSTAVVIPALYDELERPALTIIRDRSRSVLFSKRSSSVYMQIQSRNIHMQ